MIRVPAVRPRDARARALVAGMCRMAPLIPERFALREIAADARNTGDGTAASPVSKRTPFARRTARESLALVAVLQAMGLSVIAAFAGMILGSYAVVIAFPAYVILAYIIGVAQFFAALPFASVSVAAFSAWWMFAAYALLFGGVWYVQKKKPDTMSGSFQK